MIDRRPGRVSGGRRAHDRGHQPRLSAARRRRQRRASTSSSSWSSAATETAQPVQLKDVGYLQVGYDLRRGIADLDGAGEVVGGIAIMEQGQNVLAVTRGARAEARRSSGRRCRTGIEIVPTYDRSALIWDTLTNFFAGARLRAGRRDPRDRRGPEERPRRGRARSASCCSARCSPRCRSRPSARPSTCSRWRAWPSPSARWPTRRSSSSRTARRSWPRSATVEPRPSGCETIIHVDGDDDAGRCCSRC